MSSSLYLFVRQSLETFRTTGAILPSSPSLARSIIEPVRELAGSRSLRILEVGAGTGPVSRALEQVLTKRDQLDLVELNPQFAEWLRLWARHRSHPGPKVRVFETDICQHQSDQPYDAIISGLPLNNFPPEMVDRIFRQMTSLVADDGTISFFEYVAIRRFKVLFLRHEKRGQLRTTGRKIRRWVHKYNRRTEYVWTNLPPAAVHHLHMRPQENEASLLDHPAARIA